MEPIKPVMTAQACSLADLQACFEEEGLSLPFIPEHKDKKLLKYGPCLYGSRDLDIRPFEVHGFIEEAISTSREPYFLLGVDGYGVENWALHYYVLHDNVAVPLQLKYPSAFSDEVFLRERINGMFHGSKLLFLALDDAKKQGKLGSPEQKLVILESDFYGKGWGWVNGQVEAIPEQDWHSEGPILFDAIGSLDKL